jgi:putative endonuclease
MSVSVGQTGEERAALYLQEHGLRIVTRNYRTKRGEIDIIADDAGTLCFVEVRLRADSSFGAPLDTVGIRKQRRLTYAAMQYLAKHAPVMNRYPCRFDVLSIETYPARVIWVKNAFCLNSQF